MNEHVQQDENLRRCPVCGANKLSLHAKARTWICRNCGYQEPLPDPAQSSGQGEQQDQTTG